MEIDKDLRKRMMTTGTITVVMIILTFVLGVLAQYV